MFSCIIYFQTQLDLNHFTTYSDITASNRSNHQTKVGFFFLCAGVLSVFRPSVHFLWQNCLLSLKESKDGINHRFSIVAKKKKGTYMNLTKTEKVKVLYEVVLFFVICFSLVHIVLSRQSQKDLSVQFFLLLSKFSYQTTHVKVLHTADFQAARQSIYRSLLIIWAKVVT